jgi:hypothetical protein
VEQANAQLIAIYVSLQLHAFMSSPTPSQLAMTLLNRGQVGSELKLFLEAQVELLLLLLKIGLLLHHISTIVYFLNFLSIVLMIKVYILDLRLYLKFVMQLQVESRCIEAHFQ